MLIGGAAVSATHTLTLLDASHPSACFIAGIASALPSSACCDDPSLSSPTVSCCTCFWGVLPDTFSPQCVIHVNAPTGSSRRAAITAKNVVGENRGVSDGC